MDFSLFQKAAQENMQKAADRHEKASEAYMLGTEYLQRALKTPQPEAAILLKKALKCYALAIATHRTYSAPYIKCAYIFLRCRNKELAVKYLKEALRLEPGHPLINELLAYCQDAPDQLLLDMKILTQKLERHHLRWNARPGDASAYDDILEEAFQACEDFLAKIEQREAKGEPVHTHHVAYDTLSEIFEKLDEKVANSG